ncbi:hypothetical protein E4U21_005047 [Claviceps maximensis]|nr:hypothetical protein E4U21_005047 [Claviceps maximensis]
MSVVLPHQALSTERRRQGHETVATVCCKKSAAELNIEAALTLTCSLFPASRRLSASSAELAMRGKPDVDEPMIDWLVPGPDACMHGMPINIYDRFLPLSLAGLGLAIWESKRDTSKTHNITRPLFWASS